MKKNQPSPNHDRKQQIREVATSLFHRNGYDATSIRQLATAVGVEVSALYYYFPSKEDILADIVCSSMRQLISEFEGAVHSSLDPSEQLRRYICTDVSHQTRYKERVMLHSSELRSLSPEHLTEVLALRDRQQGILEDILTRGMQQGNFAKGDVKLEAYAILGIVSRVARWFSPQGRLTAEDIADYYYRLILDGLSGTRSKEVSQ